MKFKRRRRFKKGVFKSKLERSVSIELEKIKGIVHSYEINSFDYVIRKKYLCDFTVDTPKGRKIFLEVKGYLSPEDRVKMRAVKMSNPEIDMRFVFDKDNKLSRKSKMTYSQWASKYGFPYAVGGIPKGWFDER